MLDPDHINLLRSILLEMLEEIPNIGPHRHERLRKSIHVALPGGNYTPDPWIEEHKARKKKPKKAPWGALSL